MRACISKSDSYSPPQTPHIQQHLSALPVIPYAERRREYYDTQENPLVVGGGRGTWVISVGRCRLGFPFLRVVRKRVAGLTWFNLSAASYRGGAARRWWQPQRTEGQRRQQATVVAAAINGCGTSNRGGGGWWWRGPAGTGAAAA